MDIIFLKYFFLYLTVSQLSKANEISLFNLKKLVQNVRQQIYKLCLKKTPYSLEIGLRDRDKIKIFGLLKRNDKVYTQVINNVSIKTSQEIIIGKVELNNVITYRCLRSL